MLPYVIYESICPLIHTESVWQICQIIESEDVNLKNWLKFDFNFFLSFLKMIRTFWHFRQIEWKRKVMSKKLILSDLDEMNDFHFWDCAFLSNSKIRIFHLGAEFSKTQDCYIITILSNFFTTKFFEFFNYYYFLSITTFVTDMSSSYCQWQYHISLLLRTHYYVKNPNYSNVVG